LDASQRPLPTRDNTTCKHKDKHPCPEQDSNPRSQQPSGQDLHLRPRGHLYRQFLNISLCVWSAQNSGDKFSSCLDILSEARRNTWTEALNSCDWLHRATCAGVEVPDTWNLSPHTASNGTRTRDFVTRVVAVSNCKSACHLTTPRGISLSNTNCCLLSEKKCEHKQMGSPPLNLC
jgi:hypothetical protein